MVPWHHLRTKKGEQSLAHWLSFSLWLSTCQRLGSLSDLFAFIPIARLSGADCDSFGMASRESGADSDSVPVFAFGVLRGGSIG